MAFVATARSADSDEEMGPTIEPHPTEGPKAWRTIEEPLDLDGVLTEEGSNFRMIVVDCLTLYAANLLDAEMGNLFAIEKRLPRFYSALPAAPCTVARVSNEVGSGIVLPIPEGCKYCDLLGESNQRVAWVADKVVLMVAGLPLMLRGVAEVGP